MQDSVHSQFTVVNEETVHAGKWIQTKKLTYQDHNGIERTWESIVRTALSSVAHGVAIIPILKRSGQEDCLILIKQFRVPMKSFVIEFPAGLVDSGETIEHAALRELKEETGYVVHQVKSVSPPTSLDPGVENATLCFAVVEIDGDLPENINPTQHLEESESIEVIVQPVQHLMSRLTELAAAGFVIDSRVYAHALALTSSPRTDGRRGVEDEKVVSR